MSRPKKMAPIHTLILGYCLILTNIIVGKDFLAEGAATTVNRILVAPQNVTVVEGDPAKMNCTVSDASGGLQWAHNGVGLGYSTSTPYTKRMKIFYSTDNSTFSEIRVENVTLDDDGDFECQLGPAKGLRLERKKAYITVLAPPKSFSINDLPEYGKLEYKQFKEVVLNCKADDARPAANLSWTFNHRTIVNSTRHVVTYRTDPNTKGRVVRYTTYSTLRFVATPEDDYAEYSCLATHPVKRNNRYMRATVILSVLYPPMDPVIEGFEDSNSKIEGTTISVTCISYGGNPPATLTWYKNQVVISRQFKTTMRKSESNINITLQRSDHESKYTCEASNSESHEPAVAHITTTVDYPPEKVLVRGPSEVRAGETVLLDCATTVSNPAATITWIKDGEHEVVNENLKTESPGGWRTFSSFTFVPKHDQSNVEIICRAIHDRTGTIVETRHPISVMQPPKSMRVTGHEGSPHLVSGTHMRLVCIVTGGNPPPTLTWYKNNKKNDSTTVHVGSITTAQLDILVDYTDNLATYRCDATNPAITYPLSKSVELNVKFPPESVDMYMAPPIARVGTTVRLHCDSSSSNPESEVSWWKNGIPIEAEPMTTKKGLFGGKVSSVDVIVNVTKELDGTTFTCQASNVLQEKTVYNSMLLNVEYPPEIDTKKEYTGIEGELLEIKLEARGNPDNFTWTWSRNGLSITLASQRKSKDRIYASGGTLIMTSVSRFDAGVYMVEVSNSRGAVTANITVNVQYAAEIRSLKQLDIPKPNEDAIVACHGNGNPFTAEHIGWEREGYDIKPTMVSFEPNNGTSYLLIERVTREDIGYFNCVVNNGIGAITRQEIMLTIKIPPEIDSSPKYLKYATKVGKAARLTCISKAVPAPTVTWRRSGSKIAVNATKKFSNEHYKIDPITYVNVLHIREVGSSDLDVYVCEVTNEMGYSNQSMKLDVLGPPDPVISLNVTNVTHNSVSITWEPGFDGGMPVRYQIRYRKIYEISYTYIDVINATTTRYTINNLERSSTYVFSIMTLNEAGHTQYLPDNTIATTLSSSEVGEVNVVATQYVEPDVPNSVAVYLTIAAAVFLIVLILAASVPYIVFKKRARRRKDQTTDAGKSHAIEMYAPPSSYNETVMGETMSSVSDKSMPFGIDHDDRGSLPDVPPRDMHQPSETFVTEQDIIPSCDYPPNYAMYEGDQHARTLPHAHKHKEFTGHTTLGRNAGRSVYVPSPCPMPPIDGSYMYNDRYLSYPPVIQEFLPHQRGTRTPTPPHQYATTTSQFKQLFSSGGAGGNPSAQHHDPLGSYFLDVHPDRAMADGTHRRRPEQNPGPPPDVTVMHQGNCPQHHLPPTPGPVKHPQSILKDPSRHKYGTNTFGSPLSSSSPQNNCQILAVHNLSEIPQYGTIRKENKKPNVTIDEGYNKRNDNVM